MNSLDGKIAVVTGAAQGLGAAVARLFAEAGAVGLITCDRNAEKGQAVAAEITEQFGVPTEFVAADLAEISDIRAVIAQAKQRFGQIDILVNAAGITDRGSLIDTSPELFDRLVAVNLRGPFFMMQEAVKVMIETGRPGSIVNIGSISGFAGQSFICPYVATKGGLSSLTRNTAFGLLRNQIRVNQLDVGWMASDNEISLQAEERGDPNWLENAAAERPFGRLLDPREAAKGVLFLASDDSGMMTGTVIPFDQSVWGGYPGLAPSPDAPMSL
ncbi:MAG: SDR family oxidoreductase [Mangrovicoccus sp.]